MNGAVSEATRSYIFAAPTPVKDVFSTGDVARAIKQLNNGFGNGGGHSNHLKYTHEGNLLFLMLFLTLI